jgi:tetratricopeptide (TPR) repeat protein
MKEPYRATALLLDALAQYRLARGRGTARRDAAELIALLATEPADSPLGQLKLQLVGIAFRELGMWEELARHHERSRPGVKGPLAATLALEHGDCLLRLRRYDEAARCFESVGADARHGATAQLRLAQVELEQGRADAVLRRCRRLWTDQRVGDPPAFFQIWAAALERTGDYENASRCLQGLPPP